MRFILITAAQFTFSLILFFFFGGRGNFALSAFLTVSSTGFAANEPGANLSYAFQLFRHFWKLFPESLKGLLWVSCCLIFLFIFALLQNIPNVYFCRLYQFFFRVFVSNDDCILMPTGINCIQAWRTTNCMKQNIGNESQYFYQDNKFSFSYIYI